MAGKIGVIGLGYIGLPLAAVLSDVGYPVVGLDVKEDMIERLNRLGKSDFYEPGLDELLAKNRDRLSFRLSRTTKHRG